MFHILLSILGILLTIFFVIGTHEYAHFITARLLGVKIIRFSIGFGKTLMRWKDKKGTEYVFALLPLGGYVKMLDEREGDVPKKDLPFAFNTQPFYKKFLIVLAGPVINIFCAFILYCLIFTIGFTTVKPIIGNITSSSIAAQGGLKANQEIIAIDNKPTSTWTSALFRLLAHIGNRDQVNIQVQNLSNKKIETHILDVSNWQMSELNPDPLKSLGIIPYEPQIPLIIGIIAANSPAQSSDLKKGDKLLSINGNPIKDWEQLITTITKHPGETLLFSIERQGKVLKLPVVLGFKRDWLFQKTGYLGISPDFKMPKDLLHKIQYPPLSALPHAWQEISDFAYFNLLLLGKMITGKLSLQSLGGPITIFESAGEALNSGFLSFIAFLAFLSVSIGIINLLPIPGLDGGHLFVQIIEFIIRRPIPDQILLNLYRVGFLLIFFVLLQALMNDILRL